MGTLTGQPRAPSSFIPVSGSGALCLVPLFPGGAVHSRAPLGRLSLFDLLEVRWGVGYPLPAIADEGATVLDAARYTGNLERNTELMEIHGRNTVNIPRASLRLLRCCALIDSCLHPPSPAPVRLP